MLEITLPCKVLLDHGFALLAVHLQLAPSIGLVINLPIVRQLLKKEKKGMITHVKWQYVAKTTNHQHKAKNAFLYKNLQHLEHILLSHLYLTWIWASMLLLVIDTPICFVQVCHCARTAIHSSACLPLSLTGSLDGVQWRLHVGDWQINMKQGLQRPGELLPLSNLRSTTLSPNQNAAPQHMGHPPPVHRSTAHLKLAQMWPDLYFPFQDPRCKTRSVQTLCRP